jgi:RNA polymerase sigma factor (sigma-70 family)
MTTTQAGLVRHLHTLIARQAHGAPTDQQLLEHFLTQRSEASFAALVERHGPMVLGVCRRVLHHTHDAEDAFQATFLVLARKANSIRKQESLGSFLHGVAYHLAEKLRTKTRRRSAHERAAASRESADPVEDITWRELRSVLDEELAKLPEQYRTPLVLCYLEGKTQDEAAKRLGWSKSTFRRRLERARDLLGRRLNRRGLALSAALSAPLLTGTSANALVPPALTATTTRAALLVGSGQRATALVSAQVSVLVAEAGTLLTAKAKAVIALVVLLSVAAGGMLLYSAREARQTASPTGGQAPALSPRPEGPRLEGAVEIKGRVLDPDGKPLGGARLVLLSRAAPNKAGESVRAKTDKDGRFLLKVRSADFGPKGTGTLIGSAEGFGLNWTDVTARSKDEITLRLAADDVPIIGRVLDLEGKPVAGASVQVRSVAKRADGKDLTAFVETVEKHLKEGTPGFLNANFQPGPLSVAMDKFQLQRLSPAGLEVPATVTTGEDGRFRLSGFGRERLLELAIHGPTIARTPLNALTRTGPARGWISGNWGLYGARFDCLAAPCKPIVGTVRDKRTGKPLAGMNIWVAQASMSEAKTDSQGRYRVVGAAKSKQYDVTASGLPYFRRSKNHVADTPGLEPLTVDFELERGVIVRGRLTDKHTGKPVRGEVQYVVLPDNPHLKDFEGINSLTGRTAVDGSFSVVAIPGPGLLCVTADEVNRFAAAEDKGWKTRGGFDTYHAVVPIDPSEKEEKSTTCDIALDPARVLKGSVVGPDDRPLTGVYAAGLSPIITFDLFAHERLDSDTFTVGGMKSGRPRMLVFFHRDKRLGKVLKLQGDESKPLTVRLEPLGTLTGRVLDAKGRPWAGLRMTVTLAAKALNAPLARKDKTYPPEFHWGYSSWPHLTSREATTDGEGRFRVEGLLPGLGYDLFLSGSEARPDVGSLTVESGKTTDLGDLKSKQTPGEPSGR